MEMDPSCSASAWEDAFEREAVPQAAVVNFTEADYLSGLKGKIKRRDWEKKLETRSFGSVFIYILGTP